MINLLLILTEIILIQKKLRKSKQKEANKGKIFIKVLVLAIVVAIPIGVYLGNQLSETAVEIIKAEKPPKPDLRSTEEKLGYVKVQIFEFADDAPVTAKEVQIKKEMVKQNEIEAKQQEEALKNVVAQNDELLPKNEKKTTASVEVKKTLIPKKEEPKKSSNVKAVASATVSTPTEKKYSIVFEDIDTYEYEKVNSLAVEYKVTTEITDSINKYKSFWRVYRVSPNSATVIGGKKVEKVQDFTDKNEAVAFAKEHNIQSIIRLEEEKNNIYSLKLCCTSLDLAKNLAQSSNIRNKTIKIIRQQ